MFGFWHSKHDDRVQSPTPSVAALVPVHNTAPRQGLNKAGIIVTKELEVAISRCRRKVQRIAKECRRNNRRYRDPEFDILDDRDLCLHGLSNPNKEQGPMYFPSDALRVNQIFEKPEFFIGGATASDIAQGSIGDCWFLSGLSLIATAGLVEKICVERDEQVGVYGFIFWRDAGWVDVIVDDLLFVQIPKWREVDENTRIMYKYDQDAYMRQARRGSKILYFSKSATDNETWVPLIEKAYAKLHGDYAALDGGLSHEAIEDLSGAVSNWMYIRDTLDPDRFWKEELLKANQDRLFACSIINAYAVNDDGRRWRDPLNGLVAQHAYSVVKAMEYNGLKFVKIRNPWGMYEWQGRWSDGSKEWTGEWLEALKALDYSFGNDGEFLMEYSDFLNTWDSVERCRLFDENWALSQLWLQVGLGEYPRPTSYGDVSFTISVSEATSAVVMLSQIDTRYFSGVESAYKFSLRFVIFRTGEKEPVATSYHDALWRRSVNVEVDLEAGDYVVQVRVDREPPAPVVPYVPPPDSGNTTLPATNPSMQSRKMVQKKTELLVSTSIAANFRASDYDAQMPLSEEIYHGVDLTSMEIGMYELKNQFRAEKKAAFKPKEEEKKVEEKKDEAKEGVGKTEGEGVAEEAKSVDGSAEGTKTPESWVKADGKSDSSEHGDPVQPNLEGVISQPQSPTKNDTKSEVKPLEASGSESQVSASLATEGAKEVTAHANNQTASTSTVSASPNAPTTQQNVNVQVGSTTTPPKEEKPSDASTSSSTPEVKSSDPAPKPEESKPSTLHDGFHCDGCGGPINGSRFHCMDIACPDYDLCDKCIKIGAHNPAHRMIEITDPADKPLFDSKPPVSTDEDVATIGLKVYASKDCQVTIRGQLRHNQVIRNYMTMSKII